MSDDEPQEQQSRKSKRALVRGDRPGTWKRIEVAEDVAGQWDEDKWRSSPPV